LHHLKPRFKKKSLRTAEQDRPDVAAARKALQKQQPRLDPKRLVFIDRRGRQMARAQTQGSRNRIRPLGLLSGQVKMPKRPLDCASRL
jgi:hypothetical protein